MAAKEYCLVFITDRSCGHCKMFEPNKQALMRDAKLNEIFRIESVEFDQANKRGLTREFDFVHGFPTIAIIPSRFYNTLEANRNAFVYSGERSVQNVKDWALTFAGRSSQGHGGASYGALPPMQQFAHAQPQQPAYAQPQQSAYAQSQQSAYAHPQQPGGISYGRRVRPRPTGGPYYYSH